MRKKARPWIRLDANVHQDAAVSLAEAGAVWPWVLCRLKLNGGKASTLELHPRIGAKDLGIPVELVERQLAGLREYGLLIEGEPGTWVAKNWSEYQIDARDVSDEQDDGRPTANRSQPFATAPKRVDIDIDKKPYGFQDARPPVREGCPPIGHNAISWQDSAGADHWAANQLRAELSSRWPDENWNSPTLVRFVGDVARKWPKATVDAALASHASRRLARPYGLRALLERGDAAQQERQQKPAGGDLRERAVREEAARLQGAPGELDDLIADTIAAGVAPHPVLRPIMRDRLLALKRAIPALLEETP